MARFFHPLLKLIAYSGRSQLVAQIQYLMGLAGCGSSRKPHLIILPSYSYLRSSLVLDTVNLPRGCRHRVNRTRPTYRA